MAGIYKRGSTYWGRVSRGGREHRRSLKTQSASVARKRLAEWVQDLDAIGWGEKPRRTLNQVAERFIHEHLPNIRFQSARRYGISLQWLDEKLGHLLIDEIGSAELVEFETWRRSRGVSAPTIRRDLACLSSLFSFAIEREWIEHNPVGAFLRRAKKRGLRESEPRTRYLSRDEELRVIDQCSAELRRAVVLALGTGLRQKELFMLTWKDVDLAAKTIVVHGDSAKGHRTRTVAVQAAAMAVLRAVPRHIRSPYVLWHGAGRPYRHMSRSFETACRRADVTDVTWHDLRRTHGCKLIQVNRWSMEMVRDQLGHSSVEVTQRSYAFLEAQDRIDRADECADNRADTDPIDAAAVAVSGASSGHERPGNGDS